MQSLITSTIVIFLAELGDKSQLMALAFATRFRTREVLIGITLATAMVHALSVGLGAALGSTLPVHGISIAAGVAFIGFGLWTLRGDSLDEEDVARSERRASAAVVTVGLAFLLAELGDKTMFATVTLATRGSWFGTWLGSTIGMVVADLMAIVVGQRIGARLPERAIRFGAAAAFFAFGIWMLLNA